MVTNRKRKILTEVHKKLEESNKKLFIALTEGNQELREKFNKIDKAIGLLFLQVKYLTSYHTMARPISYFKNDLEDAWNIYKYLEDVSMYFFELAESYRESSGHSVYFSENYKFRTIIHEAVGIGLNFKAKRTLNKLEPYIKHTRKVSTYAVDN